jgi:hypothetical protein
MGKDEAQIRTVGEPQLGDDRLEIMAVRAQPVQPNDRCLRLGSGISFDSLQQ